MAFDSASDSFRYPDGLPSPDLMNDPIYETNKGNGEDGAGDTDTCRICRGEAAELEPLFYPCKCSGSIKFVHQDCLMEWLSHSQKKHCELCKTPFRFTKLYSPNMPQSLPTYVFIRQLVVHALKNIIIWLRFCLVLSVWLGCLPLTMRHIWGFLFWFGDGGWTSRNFAKAAPYNDTEAPRALENLVKEFSNSYLNGTSPASSFMARPTTSAAIGGLLSKLLQPVKEILKLGRDDLHQSDTFQSISSEVDSFQSLFSELTLSPEHEGVITDTIQRLNKIVGHSSRGPSSLLSDVRFLKGLTKHPRLNNVIIATLEGQIITIVVVVCFILVFLIREWVVQQQPGINMGQGFNADVAGERAPRNRNALPENVQELAAGEAILDGNFQDMVQRQPGDMAVRPIARPRRRVRFDEGQGNDARLVNGDRELPLRRPPSPRDVLAPTADIPQRLAEDTPRTQIGIDTGEFVALWRRAGGSPDEVLRIIEAEGLGEKLRYWKSAMETLRAVSAQDSSADETRGLNGQSLPSSSADGPAAADDEVDTVNQSWADMTTPADDPSSANNTHLLENHPDRSPLSRKGKEKMAESTHAPLSDASNGLVQSAGPSVHQLNAVAEITPRGTEGATEVAAFQSSPGRPRAVSEGNQSRDRIAPLADNYWSFSNLPNNSLSRERPSPTHNVSPSESSKVAREFQIQESDTQQVIHDFPDSDAVKDNDSAPPAANDGIEIYKQDEDRTQVARSWDDVFERNPVSDSENDFEENPTNEADSEPNPFHPDENLPDGLPPAGFMDPEVPRPQQPNGILAYIANFLWADVNTPQDTVVADDEHVVQDLAAEAPFVPVANRVGLLGLNDIDDEGANQDRDVLAAAIAAGIDPNDPNDPNDPDGIDDAEDFEGIMELVGMRGPLTALLQNGLFCAVLISLTVTCGVWVPYNVGRLVLLLVANPIATVKLPLKFLFSFAAVLQDLAAVALGSLSFLLIKLCSLPKFLYSYTASGPVIATAMNASSPALESLRFAETAGRRVMNGFLSTLVRIPESDVPAFSAVSHESLLYIKSSILSSLESVGSIITAALVYLPPETRPANGTLDVPALWATVSEVGLRAGHALRAMPTKLATAEPWVINLDLPPREIPLDPTLSYWNGIDRFWAILVGYVAFCFLGAAYLRKGSPFSSSQTGREWEATIIDVLNQAGGVIKVILIISIEMLVFPLYCGLLLDIALLPLFDNATVLSRVLFTIETPLTSVFVHWFVGTCYMFHFALFVSMCRKIMRKGVLYFIRDPDDPTFHPVRDVLERSVTTQLRKIAFSAMVYGGLVVICLGGVVWGLSFAFKGVLPIHWSSNEPVLEFPIDLLFYNFFMPLAVKFFKPSDGLHAMYTWWFRKCARFLRLTWFLFDERKLDEEGHHVRKSWADYFRGVKGNVEIPVSATRAPLVFESNPDLSAYFLRDGMYARVPASDQVRIPKGALVFLEVDERNWRLDTRIDRADNLHSRASQHFKMVHIPPHFRGRIFLFILFIWLFAAITGVCITIVPLVFGRLIFARIIPVHVRKNDVYAFSIGIYILGSVIYCAIHIKHGIGYIQNALAVDANTPTNVLRKAKDTGLWILRLIYAYAAFALVLPSLFAFAVEFYFIVPFHTYFGASEPHVVHFVQSWTLGLLYVKLTSRFILWHADSRPAKALEAVTRNGYLDPNIKIATRAFILPATTILLAALVVPFSLASVANRFEMFGSDPTRQMLGYRYAYPLFLSMLLNAIGFWLLLEVMKGWRMRIRDEVYLIGERLHNFGDRRKSGTAVLIPTGNRIET